MGRFNNYQSDLMYTPQTFEKLSILPMMLRKRQDDMEAQNDLIGVNIADTKVSAGYEDAYRKKREEFDAKSKNLAERMAAEGAGNPNLIREFQNLKRQYNNDAAATGIFGQGKKEYSDQLENERLYTAYGVEKAGQNPDVVAQRWTDDYNKRQDMIKEGLAKDPNYIAPAYVHNYAPKAVDTTDFAQRIAKFIGKDTEEHTRENLRKINGIISRGPDGSMIVDTDSTFYQTNKDQVDGFVALMKSTIMDKTSPLSQHFKYNNVNPEDYLDDVNAFASMLHSTTDKTAKSERLYGGSGGGKGTDPEEEKKKDVFIERRKAMGHEMSVIIPGYNEDKPTNLNPTTAGDLLQRMEDFEQSGRPIPDVKAYTAQKQAAIDYNKQYKEWEMAHINDLDKAAKKEGYSSYDNFSKKRKIERDAYERELLGGNSLDEMLTSSQTKADKIRINYVRSVLNGFDKETESRRNDIIEETGSSNLLMQQNVYGFGFSDESDKLVQASSKYFQNNSIFLKNQVLGNSFAYEINKDGKQVPIDDLGKINAEMAQDIKVTHIATKNSKGVPSVGIEMTIKDGEGTKKQFMDLEVGSDESSVARGTIKKMLETTNDKKTAYILQSILDSADVNQVIPDSPKYQAGPTQSGASSIQSNMVINFNKSSGGGSGTINKNGSYQVISQGEHYALNVKQKGDDSFHIYNINDLMNDRIPKSNSTSPEYKQSVRNNEVASLYLLTGYDPKVGVASFSEGVSPISPEDNGSKRKLLAEAFDEYESLFNGYNATLADKNKATNDFIEKTRNIGLKSMNKAAFLKN